MNPCAPLAVSVLICNKGTQVWSYNILGLSSHYVDQLVRSLASLCSKFTTNSILSTTLHLALIAELSYFRMANEVGSTRLGNDSRREQKLWSLDPQDLKKGSDYRNLAGLLRLCNIKHRDDRIGYFWSSDLITRIMTEDRVKEALSSECGISVFPNRWRVGRPFDDFDDLVELIREVSYKSISAIA